MTDARVLAEIIIALHKFFKGDMDKVEMWLNCSNRNLGESSPMTLIQLGKTNKVYQFVMAARAERIQDAATNLNQQKRSCQMEDL